MEILEILLYCQLKSILFSETKCEYFYPSIRLFLSPINVLLNIHFHSVSAWIFVVLLSSTCSSIHIRLFWIHRQSFCLLFFGVCFMICIYVNSDLVAHHLPKDFHLDEALISSAKTKYYSADFIFVCGRLHVSYRWNESNEQTGTLTWNASKKETNQKSLYVL